MHNIHVAVTQQAMEHGKKIFCFQDVVQKKFVVFLAPQTFLPSIARNIAGFRTKISR